MEEICFILFYIIFSIHPIHLTEMNPGVLLRTPYAIIQSTPHRMTKGTKSIKESFFRRRFRPIGGARLQKWGSLFRAVDRSKERMRD